MTDTAPPCSITSARRRVALLLVATVGLACNGGDQQPGPAAGNSGPNGDPMGTAPPPPPLGGPALDRVELDFTPVATVMTGMVRHPRLAVGPSGALHAIGSIDGEVVYTRSDDGGKTWLPAGTLARGTDPDIAVDGAGGVFVGWSRNVGGFIPESSVYVTRSFDLGATWDRPTLLTPIEKNNYYNLSSVALRTDVKGNVYAAWIGYVTNPIGVEVAKSSDRGMTWPTRARVPEGGNNVYDDVSIDVDAASDVYVAWSDRGGNLQFARTQGAALNSFKRTSISDPGRFPDLAVGTGGVVTMAFAGTRRFVDDPYVIRSFDGGASWSKAVQVSTLDGDLRDEPLRPVALLAESSKVFTLAWATTTLVAPGIKFRRTIDGGQTWSRITILPGPPALGQQPVFARTPDRIVLGYGGTGFYVSAAP